MKLIASILLLTFITNFSNAQSKDGQEVKWILEKLEDNYDNSDEVIRKFKITDDSFEIINKYSDGNSTIHGVKLADIETIEYKNKRFTGKQILITAKKRYNTPLPLGRELDKITKSTYKLLGSNIQIDLSKNCTDHLGRLITSEFNHLLNVSKSSYDYCKTRLSFNDLYCLFKMDYSAKIKMVKKKGYILDDSILNGDNNMYEYGKKCKKNINGIRYYPETISFHKDNEVESELVIYYTIEQEYFELLREELNKDNRFNSLGEQDIGGGLRGNVFLDNKIKDIVIAYTEEVSGTKVYNLRLLKKK